MTIGGDQNKGRCQNWQVCDVWKLRFCEYGATKHTQNCVCSNNPGINLLVLPSVTRQYHLLQRIATYLQRTLACVSGETFLGLLGASFHSHFVASSRELTECMSKTMFRGFNCSTKLSANSKRTIVQLPTVGKEHMLLAERLWFNSTDTDTNSEQEYNDLTSSNRRPSTPYYRNTPQSFCCESRSYVFFRSTKHAWTSLTYFQNFSKNFWRVKIWSVVLRSRGKSHYVSSSFGLNISRHLFSSSGVTWGQTETSAPGRGTLGAKLRSECYLKITKCQRMLVITIYKMSNANGCYPVAKSRQDYQSSQSEQLRTLVKC